MVFTGVTGRPQTSFSAAPQAQQLPANSPSDLRSGISGLADGARTTAFLIDEGGITGLDILNQFGQLFRKFDET